MIRVGTLLFGYCGGYFGDSYGTKRVEAVGADWIVVRELAGLRRPLFSEMPDGPDILEEYANPEILEDKEPRLFGRGRLFPVDYEDPRELEAA